MAQPPHIELNTGYDRLFRISTCLLWLISAAVVILHLTILHWTLSLIGTGVLFAFWPKEGSCDRTGGRLRLYCNGVAILGEQTGRWGKCYWSTRRYTMLRMDLPQGSSHVLVPASRNHQDDYRRLLVWNRFPPFDNVPCMNPTKLL